MKYIYEYRDGKLGRALLSEVNTLAEETGPAALMEVCGTHTTALFRGGLRTVLPPNVRLISGPGCPVCVTPAGEIALAAAVARRENVVTATFGDMVRVPGGDDSLEAARADGADVRVVYSPLDALQIARRNPDKLIVFIGVGFETTSPTVAAAILRAADEAIDNFTVLCSHKLIPPALDALCAAPGLKVRGFICPGHVSVIIGLAPYRSIAARFGIPCVVTGFEPVDLLQGILMLLRQIRDGRAAAEIQYSRIVRADGNPKAREMMDRVFTVADAEWRGLGVVPVSGYVIADEFARFDARARLNVESRAVEDPPGCLCGEILTGAAEPSDCPLFGGDCAPDSPVGPCMVSSEGACSAHLKYGTLNIGRAAEKL